jgi:hypothetical protein
MRERCESAKPGDVFFEMTGVLQFLAALMTARASLALWQGRHE